MSTDVTMQDLELETAELLPSRETLWSHSGHSGGISAFNPSATAVNSQNGLINVNVLGGDNVLSGDNIFL
ncbi:MAG: hypothetical protein WB800_07460 [Streptosporangiaceae bacterium]